MDALDEYLKSLRVVLKRLPLDKLTQAADALHAARRRRATVFVVGNGGSAATASHFACDLTMATRAPGFDAFRVVALTDNVPSLTTRDDDDNQDHVFSEQLRALASPGDVVLVLAASREDASVVETVQLARSVGAIPIALTGSPGKRLADAGALCVGVPSNGRHHVEDAHLAMLHAMCNSLLHKARSDPSD